MNSKRIGMSIAGGLCRGPRFYSFKAAFHHRQATLPRPAHTIDDHMTAPRV
jgi:hypothetical protein